MAARRKVDVKNIVSLPPKPHLPELRTFKVKRYRPVQETDGLGIYLPPQEEEIEVVAHVVDFPQPNVIAFSMILVTPTRDEVGRQVGWLPIQQIVRAFSNWLDFTQVELVSSVVN